MVLGLKSKSRTPTSTQVDYTIHIQEIKPWPPSQSLKSLKSVLLQWENGPKNSGTTTTVTPSQTKIEFNESFNLHITLLNKGGGYQRNALEFSLYEPRRDKSLKAQILGNAVVDLAEYGVIKEIVRVGVPLICKRSFRNASQPIVYVKIQALDREKSSSSSSSFRDECLSKESVSALMSEEYLEEEEEEAEIASFTDDDVSSVEVNSEEVRSREDQHVHLKNEANSNDENKESMNLTLEPKLYTPEMEQMTTEPDTKINDLPQSSPIKLSIDAESMDNGNTYLFESSIEKDAHKEENVHSGSGNIVDDQIEVLRTSSTPTESEQVTFIQENNESMQKAESLEENIETKSLSNNSLDRKPDVIIIATDQVKKARFPIILSHTKSDFYVEDVKEIDSLRSNHKIKVPNKRVQELEDKIEILEKELREVAAMEISLYSIVAEHGSSMHKVHTPARRLSRLYIHGSSVESKASAARSIVSGLVLVAKACGNDVSRLTFWMSNSIVLRAIITRGVDKSEILKKADAKLASNGSRLNDKGKSSPPLKWESLTRKRGTSHLTEDFIDWEDFKTFTHALERIESWIFSRVIESLWWQTLTPQMQWNNGGSQSSRCSVKKNNIARQTSIGNYSTEIWKNAFNDACERLCPVRAAGHECGCLSIIAKLVMEQCVARLDVAMFNAILRESVEDIPTDPVSDPISDATVLPIQPGNLSFGAGAQLKNSIGNWSRWLTDLFGMDTDEYPQCKDQQDNELHDIVQTFKSFSLLHALSDLLMLPKDLLLEKSIRKEVCPTFSATMIKRILANFSPDEFCPDPLPEDVLEALDLEDSNKSSEEEIQDYPYKAGQMSYTAPSVSSIENIIGDVRTTAKLKRSSSSVIRKCHTSDDELNELGSPLASISAENSSTQSPSPDSELKGYKSAKYIRYQLLHDVWKIDD